MRGILGETADLNEFLLGSERASLSKVRPTLMDIQRGCFDCGYAFIRMGSHGGALHPLAVVEKPPRGGGDREGKMETSNEIRTFMSQAHRPVPDFIRAAL